MPNRNWVFMTGCAAGIGKATAPYNTRRGSFAGLDDIDIAGALPHRCIFVGSARQRFKTGDKKLYASGVHSPGKVLVNDNCSPASGSRKDALKPKDR